ncbi:hypothetical protein IPF37_04620 [bacterium]|nr:MAG: hypothetical protein IPF37_04620 [bacterium]
MKKYYALATAILFSSTAFTHNEEIVTTLQTMSDEILASAEVFMPYKKNPEPENAQALSESIIQSCMTTFDMNDYRLTRPLKAVSTEDKTKLHSAMEQAKQELAQQKFFAPHQAQEMVKIFTEHLIASFTTILGK